MGMFACVPRAEWVLRRTLLNIRSACSPTPPKEGQHSARTKETLWHLRVDRFDSETDDADDGNTAGNEMNTRYARHMRVWERASVGGAPPDE